MLYVVRLEFKNEGSRNFLVDADDDRDAEGIALSLKRDMDAVFSYYQELEPWLDGDVVELCTF